MPTILESKSIYYDDVNLIAQPSFANSRKDINVPASQFIVSPMQAVVGEKFAIAALNLGLTVCYPRFHKISAQYQIPRIYAACGEEDIRHGHKDLWIAVGLDGWEQVKYFSRTLGHKSFLIDIANGYLNRAVIFCNELQNAGYRVMVGNVHTSKGFNMYRNCKVRVGLSQGSACKTADMTGVTRGQVTEILDCYHNRYSTNQKIVADGGITNPGIAAKAFGLGADKVMLGRYFAVAEEAQNVIDGEYSYWGGASHKQQMKEYGQIRRHSEGKELTLDKSQIKPLKELVDDLVGGVQSAISYTGCHNLTQFVGCGTFEIKQNSQRI